MYQPYKARIMQPINRHQYFLKTVMAAAKQSSARVSTDAKNGNFGVQQYFCKGNDVP